MSRSIHQIRRRLALACGVAVLVAVSTLVTSVSASSAVTPYQASRAGGGWLSRQFTPGGFVRSPFDGTPDIGSTANAVLALAAADVGGQQAQAGIAYLQGHFGPWVNATGVDNPGRLATLVLAASSIGVDARNFGGTLGHNNLVHRLQAAQQTTGPDAGLYGGADPTFDGAYRQGLSLMALSSVGVTDPLGVAWLSAQQCTDGGWTAYRADTSVACPAPDPATFSGPDTNSSALAAEALVAQGATFAHRPVPFFMAAQSSDGGFAYIGGPDQASDANSTGVVIQALVALRASSDQRFTRPGGATPFTALLGFEVGCSAALSDRGAFAYQPSSGTVFPDLFATLQAVPAAARVSYPLRARTPLDVKPRLYCPA